MIVKAVDIRGRIVCWSGWLMVADTPEVHEKIDAVLAGLRQPAASTRPATGPSSLSPVE